MVRFFHISIQRRKRRGWVSGPKASEVAPMTCHEKLQPSVVSPRSVSLLSASRKFVIPPVTGSSRRNVAVSPVLHRNFEPLTAVHAMTYWPPGQGLKPTIPKNHAG